MIFLRIPLVGLFAALLAFAPAASADPALWKVSSGVSTAYIFGSVHLLEKSVVWKNPKVQAALDQSQEIWLEVADLDNPVLAKSLTTQYGLDAAHPLSKTLDDAHRAKLTSILKGLGAPPTALDAERPWLAAVSLSLYPLQKAGFDPEAGVDKLVNQEADREGKPVHGFETFEQQIRYLADLSKEEQADLLNSSLDEYDGAVDELRELERAWEEANLPMIDTLMREETPPRLYSKLVVERNRRFAAAIANRLQTPGVIFVVVGAGHLAGPQSVQIDLTDLGLSVQRQ